jgi:hypothetical protein
MNACLSLCVLLLLAAGAGTSVCAQQTADAARAQSNEAAKQASRARYRINLKLDFDARTFTGTERVRWVNADTRPASVIYFHLYANHRGGTAENTRENTRASSAASATTNAATNASAAPDASQSDEPHLDVTEVRMVAAATSAAATTAAGAQPLGFTLDEQRVTLRVQLREAVAAGAGVEIEIAFKGSVPEIDPDETSLPAHVVQQVGAALRDTREWRRGRDTNFFSRGVMLLGTPYPVLAVREGDDWQRKVEASVGDALYTDVAAYEVTIEAPSDVVLYTSGDERGDAEINGSRSRSFAGENLRNFAVVAGRTLRSSERAIAGVRVRSIYTAEHETIGRRVLGVAAEAVRVFVAHFGESPFKTINVTEAPLIAGVGSMEFARLGVVASAFYVDFDAPATRNLPEIVREQRASVEDSLEFTVAHVVGHQWWGACVGNDPERAPVLDESLAHWSALLYYQEMHGPERAAQVLDDQLRGVYQIYRTFGGDDMAADRDAREYRNSFQYSAIVSGKGALMFNALRKQMGDERFRTALRRYYEANRFEIAELDDLEAAFVAEVPVGERRTLTRIFNRWLSEKRGDEDIAPPNPQLAAALGLSVEQSGAKDRNRFARLGRFFWRQMTRIR